MIRTRRPLTVFGLAGTLMLAAGTAYAAICDEGSYDCGDIYTYYLEQTHPPLHEHTSAANGPSNVQQVDRVNNVINAHPEWANGWITAIEHPSCAEEDR